MRRALLALAVALVLPAPAAASEAAPTQAELERELICPVCEPATLDQSDSGPARRMKAAIRTRIAAGDTKSEVKAYIVDQFGPQVLAAPPRSGFNWLAWILPLAGLVGGAVAIGAAAWRWSRSQDRVADVPLEARNGRPQIEPELERRLEEELARFD